MKRSRFFMSVISLLCVVALSFSTMIGITYSKYFKLFVSEDSVKLNIDLISAHTKTAFAVLDSQNTLHIFNRYVEGVEDAVDATNFPESFELENGSTVSGTVYYPLSTGETAGFRQNGVRESITKVIVQDDYAPTSLANFFLNCTNVTEMDLGKLDTSLATSMARMFKGCLNLPSSIFINWTINTTSATTLSEMFRDCNGIDFHTIPGVAFTRDEVTEEKPLVTYDLSHMFRGCGKLTSVDLTNLQILPDDTAHPVRMHCMFRACEKLPTIIFPDVKISSFYKNDLDKQNSGLANMFFNCQKLKSVDLSFVVGDFYSATEMFTNCWAIETIIVSKDFAHPTHGSPMFYDCRLLTGEKGTSYSQKCQEENNGDENGNPGNGLKYAYIDGQIYDGKVREGFFTAEHEHTVNEWKSLNMFVHTGSCSYGSGGGGLVQEKHDFIDGVCASCGHECEHDVKIYKNITGTTHDLYCNICNHLLNEDNRAHGFTDGVCTGCGYKCTHTYGENGRCITCDHECTHDRYVYSTTPTTHSKQCKICGVIVASDVAHNYVDGVCSECGYTGSAEDDVTVQFTENGEYDYTVFNELVNNRNGFDFIFRRRSFTFDTRLSSYDYYNSSAG